MTDTSHPIANAYAEAITAEDLQAVIDLFAEGAVLRHPVGTYTGIEELTGFYRDVVLAGRAKLVVGAVLALDGLVMAEVSATSPLDPNSGTAHAMDIFRLDHEGRIDSLEIYYR